MASPSLARLLGRRFASPRSAALVIVALTALAAFVLAAAPRALVGVVREETAHQVSRLAPVSRDVSGTVSAMLPAGAVTEIEGRVLAAREQWPEALRAITEDAAVAVFTSPLPATAAALSPIAPEAEVQLLADPDAREHLRLVDGRWPAAADHGFDIVLSQDAATTMMWPLGEVRTVPLGQGGAPVAVELVGTVAAGDPGDPRWGHLPTALTATVFDDGNRRPIATAAAWVDPAVWDDVTAESTVTVWFPVDPAAAADVDEAELLAVLRAVLASPLALDEASDIRLTLDSALVAALATAAGRADAARAILSVAAVGPIAVAVSLIVLAAALMTRRRQPDIAVLSARGLAPARLVRLVAVEGLLLGLPVSVLAALAAVVAFPQDAGIWPTLCAVGLGVAPALALTAGLRRAAGPRSREDLDAARPRRAGRVVQGVVVVLAVLAVVLLLVRGVGSGPTDPLVVIAPLLVTVALALIMVRLHPLPLAAALRLARRRRGAVTLIGAARAVREPAAGTTAVLAMLVAVAIAMFSSVILSTIDRGAVLAAERAVGADIQLSGPYVDSARLAALAEIDGVQDVAGVLRGAFLNATGPEGSVSAETIVTDPAALARVQAGMAGGFPAGVLDGSTPMQVVVSQLVASEVGGVTSTVGAVPVSVAATVDRILGVTASAEFVVLGAQDYTAITGRGFFPRTVLIDVDADASVADVVAAVAPIVGDSFSVTLREESTAEIRSSPVVNAVRSVLLGAVGVAVGLSAVALLLVAGVTRDGRSRVIALLRTMGMSRRESRGIVAWEFVPLAVTALVGGVILGLALPLLVIVAVDLRPFVGGGPQPALSLDPVLSATLVAIVLAALAVTVIGSVLGARATSMGAVLRSGEE